MYKWLADNWWWLLPVVGGIALVTFKVKLRGGSEPLATRITYALLPVLDARSELRQGMSQRKLLVIAVAMIIGTAIFVLLESGD